MLPSSSSSSHQHRFRLNGKPVLSQREKLIQKIEAGVQRKSHFKSRNGCAACKQKRVKCDEVKPICGKCAAKGTTAACLYNNNNNDGEQSQQTLPIYQIQPKSLTLAGINQLANTIIPAELLLHHFYTHTSQRLMGGEKRQFIYRYHMLPLSISQHSLLHAILAVSARDLLYLHRHHQDCQHGYQQINEQQKLELSFYHHYHRFATLYKDDLLRQPSTETANLAHSNAFLMNVLVVADPACTSSSTSNSWVTRKAKDNIDAAFSWIKVQAIHQTILKPYWKFVPSTFWYSVFVDDHHQQKDDQEQEEPSVNTTTGIRNIIIDHLAIICATEETSTTTPERNVYLSAYKNLCSILTTPIPRTSRTPSLSAQIFGTYIKFMIELNAHFVNLLRSKDEPALLMFSIWLNRMRRLDLWWMNERAGSECAAIWEFLESSNNLRVREVVRLVQLLDSLV
ncbi:hypothetical protein AnigIFM62618_009322 [Aspergillus niger]|nr:hypothetical protein AnigIFM62618_009322 [Aspergillus niger]